ncbi:beta-lactamase family protein [bacterium]|nr:beta-lactamase family protein [bacterium]
MNSNKSMTILSVVIISTILVGCASYKPYKPNDLMSNDNNQLQKILDSAINEYKLPGLQAGILFPDGKMMLASSGTEDFEHQRSYITNQNIFRIGSTTKMFVAALISRLMEEGQLSYDDTIDKWFPDLPSANSITIKELLNHNSGIGENLFTNPMILIKSVLSDKKQWDAQIVVNNIMKNMKVTPIDQRSFVYANNNYLLLGLIAEKVGKDKIANQLENEFFKPLKMKNTYFLPYYKQLPDELISGYDEYLPFGPHVIKPSNISWSTLTYSAGSMASTSEDLVIWLDAFFHYKVLKRETLQMSRIYINARENGRDNNIVGYGLGLAQYELNGYKMEGHPGGGFGGECFPFYFPEKDVSIVVSYNWSKKDNPAGKILITRIIEQIVNNTNQQSK